MIRRTMNAALFDAVCNHPDVRPWLGGEGPIDTGPMLSNPGNYGLFGEGGGFILVAGPAASFEVHSQFVPEDRLRRLRRSTIAGRVTRAMRRSGFFPRIRQWSTRSTRS
jgi:hypothetical protein